MNVAAKLSVFVAGTFGLFVLAYGVGSLVDPIAPSGATVEIAADEQPGGAHGGQAPVPVGTGSVGGPAEVELPGLAVAERGYALQLLDTTPGQGESVEVAFTVAGPDGGPTTDYTRTHEKEMHLIVVRRDLTGFAHLHPERDGAGTWRVPVNLAEAGAYRVFADFAPTALGEAITLGSDLFVSGTYAAAEPSALSSAWSADGYEVALSGDPRAGTAADLSFVVRRDGVEVADLEPYLGAFGHLVSLREGDLAYLHTHPAEEARAEARGGPAIRFGTAFPTAGRYRLYLNFAHAGTVRTAEFTVAVPAGAPAPAPAAAAPIEAPASAPAPAPAGGHGGH